MRHGFTLERFLVTGLLYGVPMAAIFAKSDWEHAVGAHYMVNMIPWLKVFWRPDAAEPALAPHAAPLSFVAWLKRVTLRHTLDNFHENGLIYGHPIALYTISEVDNAAFDVAGIPANRSARSIRLCF
jgi:hypothetical protein